MGERGVPYVFEEAPLDSVRSLYSVLRLLGTEKTCNSSSLLKVSYTELVLRLSLLLCTKTSMLLRGLFFMLLVRIGKLPL